MILALGLAFIINAFYVQAMLSHAISRVPSWSRTCVSPSELHRSCSIDKLALTPSKAHPNSKRIAEFSRKTILLSAECSSGDYNAELTKNDVEEKSVDVQGWLETECKDIEAVDKSDVILKKIAWDSSNDLESISSEWDEILDNMKKMANLFLFFKTIPHISAVQHAIVSLSHFSFQLDFKDEVEIVVLSLIVLKKATELFTILRNIARQRKLRLRFPQQTSPLMLPFESIGNSPHVERAETASAVLSTIDDISEDEHLDVKALQVSSDVAFSVHSIASNAINETLHINGDYVQIFVQTTGIMVEGVKLLHCPEKSWDIAVNAALKGVILFDSATQSFTDVNPLELLSDGNEDNKVEEFQGQDMKTSRSAPCLRSTSEQDCPVMGPLPLDYDDDDDDDSNPFFEAERYMLERWFN